MQLREFLRLAVVSIAFFWVGLGLGDEGLTGAAVRTGLIGTGAAVAAFTVVWFVRRAIEPSSKPTRPQP